MGNSQTKLTQIRFLLKNSYRRKSLDLLDVRSAVCLKFQHALRGGTFHRWTLSLVRKLFIRTMA